MFEVGKLTDESLDSFLGELEKVTLLFELIFKMSKTPKKKMKRMLSNMQLGANLLGAKRSAVFVFTCA